MGMYQDGYNTAARRIEEDRAPSLASVESAQRKCQEMGWTKLQAFFQGQIDALKKEAHQ